MSQKKQQANPFYFFMLDFKKREEAKGVSFPGGLRDIANACSEEWRNMTPQEKGPYESRAKDAKVKSGLSGVKYTSQGVPIPLIEQDAKRKQDFENNMHEYIKSTVNMFEHQNKLVDKKFYFIHVNFLCHVILPNGEADFYPIEFAVAEFSLKNGVANIYHEIIDIDVPMGYTFEAAKRAEESHRIFRNPTGGQKNFTYMFQKLKDLLKPETIGDELPPLYTSKRIAEIVPGLLKRMVAAAGGVSVDMFRIYSLEILFYHLRNATAARAGITGFPVIPIAEMEIQKDPFDHASGIACEYHKDMDGAMVHCSRSIVVRWGYTICDFCCMDIGIDMKPGYHCPLSTDFSGMVYANETEAEQRYSGLASMTGVTEEYRLKTSERTYREEQERRQNSRPLEIIDHSKLQDSTAQEMKTVPTAMTATSSSRVKIERPLRRPISTSWAMRGAESDKVPSNDEQNFPPLGGGRGAALRKTLQQHLLPLGRGRGIPFNE